jgi:hypothetical protein
LGKNKKSGLGKRKRKRKEKEVADIRGGRRSPFFGSYLIRKT